MGRRSAGLILSLVMLLAGCSSQPAGETDGVGATQSGTHLVSGLAVVPVVISTANASHTFRAELADTPDAQREGLMRRTTLGADEAMLFPNDRPTAQVFHMKDTPIPLDIVFVGPDGRIANIAAMAQPNSEELIYSVGSSIAALEIRGGRAAELGIAAGDAVSW